MGSLSIAESVAGSIFCKKVSPGLVVAGSVLPCTVGVHSFAGDHTECCFASQVFCDTATGDRWQSSKDEDREAALQS